MSKWSRIVHAGPRGVGKTYQMALAAKALKGVMICFDARQAEQLKAEHGINTFPYTDNPDYLRGLSVPLIFDPDAVVRMLQESELEIEALNRRLKTAEAVCTEESKINKANGVEDSDAIRTWKRLRFPGKDT